MTHDRMHDEQQALSVQIERYLSHRLTETELAAFEAQLMEDPSLLEQVQLAEALRSAMRAQPALLAPPRTLGLSFAGWCRHPLSMVASVLIAVLGWQAFDGPVPSAQAVGTTVLLETTRGSEQRQFSGPPPYLLQLDLGFGAQASDVHFELRDGVTGAVLQRLDALRADPEGWVRVMITEPLQGSFAAELRWLEATATPQQRRYDFSVSAP